MRAQEVGQRVPCRHTNQTLRTILRMSSRLLGCLEEIQILRENLRKTELALKEYQDIEALGAPDAVEDTWTIGSPVRVPLRAPDGPSRLVFVTRSPVRSAGSRA